MLARSYIGSGNASAAADAMRRWQQTGATGAPEAASVDRLSEAVADLGDRGYWTWRLAEREAAAAMGRSVTRTELAAAHAALGHDEEALGLLADAVEGEERDLLTLSTDPVWDELRGDRRFRAMERQAQSMRFAPTLSGGGRRGRASGG